MRIVRWNVNPNYGDLLNEYLWPKLLSPQLATVLPSGVLHGIGSVLGPASSMPRASHHVIFGAGAGYGGPPTFGAPVKTYFVRGPVTARYIPDAPYITDPGVLMARYYRKSESTYECSFMPRWNSLGSDLTEGLRAADIHLIDPTHSVDEVTTQIAATGLLLTEALHGAVVADALRVPWICIRAQDGHDFKWHDWCGSMRMVWNPIDAQGLGLTWARKYAVPQLSAPSVLEKNVAKILMRIDQLNHDIENESIFA